MKEGDTNEEETQYESSKKQRAPDKERIEAADRFAGGEYSFIDNAARAIGEDACVNKKDVRSSADEDDESDRADQGSCAARVKTPGSSNAESFGFNFEEDGTASLAQPGKPPSHFASIQNAATHAQTATLCGKTEHGESGA